MTDQKNSNQVVRELKQLDSRKPDPSLLNIREMTGRNINEELHIPSIRQPHPGPIHVLSTVHNLEKNICLPPPISQSTPALVNTILPQSSSDLDTDGVKSLMNYSKNVQIFNQTLLMTTTGNPTSNLYSNKITHDNISDRQLTPMNDIKMQTIAPPKDTYKLYSSKHIHINSITTFEKK